MITNGIEIRCDADYAKLRVSPALRSLIREVHSHTGSPAYEMRYSGEPTRGYERRSAPVQPEWRYFRQDDIAREKLRLQLAVLQRMRA